MRGEKKRRFEGREGGGKKKKYHLNVVTRVFPILLEAQLLQLLTRL